MNARIHMKSGTSLFLMVFLPLALLFGATASTDAEILSPDPLAAAASAWQLANHGNLTLDDVPLENIWFVPVDDRTVSNRQPGVIAAGVPFYLTARVFDSGFSLWPMAMASATITAAAMGVLALLIQPLVGRRNAVIGALVGGLATASWAVSADGLWTHGPDQLLLAVAMLGLVRRHYWLTGLACGLAIPVRTHLAVVALIMGIAALVASRQLRALFAVGVPAALGLLAVLVYTHSVFGVWSLNAGYTALGGYPSARLVETPPLANVTNLLGFFLSPDRGLLLMSPFLLALLPGLRSAWRDAPGWVRGSALAGLAYLLIQARLNGFTGGARFWGSRLTLESLMLWTPLLALAWKNAIAGRGDRVRLFAALIAVSASIQAVGAMIYTPPGTTPGWSHSWLLRLIAIGPHRGPVLVLLMTGLVAAIIILLHTDERVAWLKARLLRAPRAGQQPRTVDPAGAVRSY